MQSFPNFKTAIHKPVGTVNGWRGKKSCISEKAGPLTVPGLGNCRVCRRSFPVSSLLREPFIILQFITVMTTSDGFKVRVKDRPWFEWSAYNAITSSTHSAPPDEI